jgi:two-component system OmpR family response regulator
MSRTVFHPTSENTAHRLRFGDWLLDPASHTLQHGDGRQAALGTTAMTLLEFFAAHPLTPLSREQLSAVLGREYVAYDRLIDVLVSQIRRTLGRTPQGAAYIRTLRSVGYVFIVPVTRA